MRILIALLVFVVALFATVETTVGSTAKLTNVDDPESIPALQMQNNGQRFLRTSNDDEFDEVDSEERAIIDTQKIGSTVKGLLSKNQRLVNLLRANTADDVLLSKKVNPTSLKNAVEKYKNKMSAADYKRFTDMADNYDDYW